MYHPEQQTIVSSSATVDNDNSALGIQPQANNSNSNTQPQSNHNYSSNTHSNGATQKASKNPIKIGPWRLGKTLGKGSTGRVLLAANVNTGKKAAVKVVSKSILNAELGSDRDERDRDSAGLSYGIEREIIIMKLLNHKNVLRLYDVWETDNALYLVLEYVEGGELFDLLVESGPLPESTAVEFFKQIVLGASYCHNLGICHRDLKPENLLLDERYNIKIADFGMAALESNDRLLETSCGSPHYAAPEIVSGLQYHGFESDVWSCGVILFALLTGRLPFDDDNIRELLLKVQKGEYEIVEDLSSEAKDLISKMLTVDPTKRIKTKDIIKHPLIQKYPFSATELQDYNDLPSPTCATNPVSSRENIDKQILENLVILWHGRDAESIIHSLLSAEANAEKTFYSLLLRYRHDHTAAKSKESIIRSQSVVSQVSKSTSSGSISSAKRKRSSQTFSASSSRKRVSFQSLNRHASGSKSNRISLQDAPALPPPGNSAADQYNSHTEHTEAPQHDSSETPAVSPNPVTAQAEAISVQAPSRPPVPVQSYQPPQQRLPKPTPPQQPQQQAQAQAQTQSQTQQSQQQRPKSQNYQPPLPQPREHPLGQPLHQAVQQVYLSDSEDESADLDLVETLCYSLKV
ncbi:unnamed protein product [Ambrosiozyma monospora]|uniref:Unnamed protein product n=1 Tax=Ambrosiozyma monospora TaxID=43982 RepID=A0ACB5T744_AMBMO|nr:unnamed protein product [Ambrosiozyma monospora]